MKGKSINTLEQLDAEMTGNGHSGKQLAKVPPKTPTKKAAKASKKNKPPVRKEAPKEKFAFRVHAMKYDDRTKAYGKCAQEEFNELAEVMSFVESQIERGQGDGLHEVAIHIR